MHKKWHSVGKATVAVALVTVVFCLTRIERPSARRPAGYPQLVSIQDFPMSPDWCPPPAPAVPEDSNLFAAFGNSSVYAGSPQSGETGIITRPPIRTIRDKDPIYSAVAVDTRFDEVICAMWNVVVSTAGLPNDALTIWSFGRLVIAPGRLDIVQQPSESRHADMSRRSQCSAKTYA